MQEHALTVKARSLLSQQASLDVSFLETLNEILEQKVYAAEGYSSSHKYLVECLGMSDDSVWRRTKAANLLLRFPALVRPLIAERRIHLTGLAMLHPVLTAENAEAVLHEASGKSKADIHKMVLRLAPRETPRTFVQMVSAEASRLHINVDAEAMQFLERIKDIAPEANLEVILKAALAAYVEQLEKQRFRKTKKPKAVPESAAPVRVPADVSVEVPDVPEEGVYVGPRDRQRYVDAATARLVYARDNYRCTFKSESGHVCGSTRNPQLHHKEAFAKGGATTAANLTVHCATHNLYQGELDFGATPLITPNRHGGRHRSPGGFSPFAERLAASQ